MNGDAQRVGIMPVDLLGPVAVMAVRIDDSDPFGSVMLPDVFHHDRLDVDVAEAPGAVDDPHGMMSRRPDQGEGVVHFPGKDLFRRRDGPRRDEVGFRDDALCLGDADVDPVDVRHRGQAGLEFADVVEIEEALIFKNLVLGIEEPFLPLRMGG